MEILILIGIFAFVVAIIFRSNEALDRVEEVEKEVKTIEDEITHKEVPVAPRGEDVPGPFTTIVMDSVPASTVDPQTENKIEAANPVNTPFPENGNVHIA